MTDDTYVRLKAPFEQTFTDVRGGVTLTYITGEQVTSRLNDVLGVAAWSFRVLEHGINTDADEAWVLGELVAKIDGESVVRQQFGSQKLKRSRSSGVIMDVGFDLKGAATDAMKKCASLLGVGLYLSEKHPSANGRPAQPPIQQQQRPAPQRQQSSRQSQPVEAAVCEMCGELLKETRFKDGTVWSVETLAENGRKKFGAVLCLADYKVANEHQKAEASQQQ